MPEYINTKKHRTKNPLWEKKLSFIPVSSMTYYSELKPENGLNVLQYSRKMALL